MSINIRQFALFVVEPTLAFVGDGEAGFETRSAVELLLGTAAVESRFSYLDQVTGPGDRTWGPAYGLFQMEADTLTDIRANYLAFREPLRRRVDDLMTFWPAPEMQLATNLPFAVAMARLQYRRSPLKLAVPGDVAGHARLWKAAYNTPAGAGTEAKFISAWRELVAPALS